MSNQLAPEKPPALPEDQSTTQLQRCRQKIATAACTTCVAASQCPILRLKRAAENQTLNPHRTDYTDDLLTYDGDNYVIAGYQPKKPDQTKELRTIPQPPPKQPKIPKPEKHTPPPKTPSRNEDLFILSIIRNIEDLALSSLVKNVNRK